MSKSSVDKYGNPRQEIVLKGGNIYGSPLTSNDDHICTVLDQVMVEINNQVKEFGWQNHDPIHYLAILGEEVGEANKAAVDAWMTLWNKTEKTLTVGDLNKRYEHLANYREEMIQVAAVAVAMILCYDRNEGDA